MKTQAISAALGAVALLAAPTAMAQQASSSCLYGGDGYSVGASIRMGSQAYECVLSAEASVAIWAKLPDEGASTNCVFADLEYGHGAVLLVDLEQRVCSRGIWYSKEK